MSVEDTYQHLAPEDGIFEEFRVSLEHEQKTPVNFGQKVKEFYVIQFIGETT